MQTIAMQPQPAYRPIFADAPNPGKDMPTKPAPDTPSPAPKPKKKK